MSVAMVRSNQRKLTRKPEALIGIRRVGKRAEPTSTVSFAGDIRAGTVLETRATGLVASALALRVKPVGSDIPRPPNLGLAKQNQG